MTSHEQSISQLVHAFRLQGADDDPAIVFTTEEGVEIVPAVVDRVVAAAAGNTNIRDLAQALATGQAIECFQIPPVPGDTLLVGK